LINKGLPRVDDVFAMFKKHELHYSLNSNRSCKPSFELARFWRL